MVWRADHAQHLFSQDSNRQYWGFAAFPPNNGVFQFPLNFLVKLRGGIDIVVEGTGIMGSPDLTQGFVGVIVETGEDKGRIYVVGADCLSIEYMPGDTEP